MIIQNKKDEEIIRQFALGLQNLDLELITDILYDELRFLYRVHDRGYGITTEARYIGHLYKTFRSMKKQGLGIKTEFCYFIKENCRYLGIKLLPPLDIRIAYPLYLYFRDLDKEYLPKEEKYMMLYVKDELITKIQCLNLRDMMWRNECTIIPCNE